VNRTSFESNGEQLAQTAYDNGRNGSVRGREWRDYLT
jgi:hypothetical protein